MANSPGPPGPRYIFREGDHALVIDRRGRQHLVRLRTSGEFHSHTGNFAHDELLGREEGTWVTTGSGHRLLAVKPTMADFSTKMPRIATVVYPKDLASLLIQGDIFSGARVLEAGSGSGAVTMTLMRAVGDEGRVFSYDVRSDMLEITRSNVDAMLPDHRNLVLKQGDVYQGFDEKDLDRMVLDLPEPWQVVPHASDRMVPGGIFFSFLPTVPQVQELTEALRRQRTFELVETTEVLIRSWTVSGRSVRPSHRMVGHTGFITTARRCSPRPREGGDGRE